MKHLVFLSQNDFQFKGIPTTAERSNLHLWYNKLKSLECHTIAINIRPSFPLLLYNVKCDIYFFLFVQLGVSRKLKLT